MDLMEAIRNRHSVRQFTDKKIEGGILTGLNEFISECNRESGLNIQLCVDKPAAFDSFLAKYGKFSNVRNYIALVGKKDSTLEEKCGYYGEKIVIYAQMNGLCSCWVGGTYKKRNAEVIINTGEKLLLIIALGYGENKGTPHKTKAIRELCSTNGYMPDWFRNGVEAAMLAPTAINQQKFKFVLENETVKAEAGFGFFTKIDLGIAKYHFESGAGKGNWKWSV